MIDLSAQGPDGLDDSVSGCSYSTTDQSFKDSTIPSIETLLSQSTASDQTRGQLQASSNSDNTDLLLSAALLCDIYSANEQSNSYQPHKQVYPPNCLSYVNKSSLDGSVTYKVSYCKCPASNCVWVPMEQTYNKNGWITQIPEAHTLRIGNLTFCAFKKTGQWFIPLASVLKVLGCALGDKFLNKLNSGNYKFQLYGLTEDELELLKQRYRYRDIPECRFLVDLEVVREVCNDMKLGVNSAIVQMLGSGKVCSKVLGRSNVRCSMCKLSVRKVTCLKERYVEINCKADAGTDNEMKNFIATVGEIKLADLTLNAFEVNGKQFLNVSELVWKEIVNMKPLVKKLQAFDAKLVKAPVDVVEMLMEENDLPFTGSDWVDVSDVRCVIHLSKNHKSTLGGKYDYKQILASGDYVYCRYLGTVSVPALEYVNDSENEQKERLGEEFELKNLVKVKLENKKLGESKIKQESEGKGGSNVVGNKKANVLEDQRKLVFVENGEFIVKDISKFRKMVKLREVYKIDGTLCKMKNANDWLNAESTEQKGKDIKIREECLDAVESIAGGIEYTGTRLATINSGAIYHETVDGNFKRSYVHQSTFLASQQSDVQINQSTDSAASRLPNITTLLPKCVPDLPILDEDPLSHEEGVLFKDTGGTGNVEQYVAGTPIVRHVSQTATNSEISVHSSDTSRQVVVTNLDNGSKQTNEAFEGKVKLSTQHEPQTQHGVKDGVKSKHLELSLDKNSMEQHFSVLCCRTKDPAGISCSTSTLIDTARNNIFSDSETISADSEIFSGSETVSADTDNDTGVFSDREETNQSHIKLAAANTTTTEQFEGNSLKHNMSEIRVQMGNVAQFPGMLSEKEDEKIVINDDNAKENADTQITNLESHDTDCETHDDVIERDDNTRSTESLDFIYEQECNKEAAVRISDEICGHTLNNENKRHNETSKVTDIATSLDKPNPNRDHGCIIEISEIDISADEVESFKEQLEDQFHIVVTPSEKAHSDCLKFGKDGQMYKDVRRGISCNQNRCIQDKTGEICLQEAAQNYQYKYQAVKVINNSETCVERTMDIESEQIVSSKLHVQSFVSSETQISIERLNSLPEGSVQIDSCMRERVNLDKCIQTSPVKKTNPYKLLKDKTKNKNNENTTDKTKNSKNKDTTIGTCVGEPQLQEAMNMTGVTQSSDALLEVRQKVS